MTSSMLIVGVAGAGEGAKYVTQQHPLSLLLWSEDSTLYRIVDIPSDSFCHLDF